MTLGERIQEQRKAKGMSQEMVAGQLGVSRQAVAKWESGRSAPSAENLYRLAELLGTTAGGLLNSPAGDGGTAEQVYALLRAERETEADERRNRRRRNLLAALAVVGVYLVIYLLGRVLGTNTDGTHSVTGWLFGNEPQLQKQIGRGADEQRVEQRADANALPQQQVHEHDQQADGYHHHAVAEAGEAGNGHAQRVPGGQADVGLDGQIHPEGKGQQAAGGL